MASYLFKKNAQYYKFCGYGFLKNLRFFDPFLLLFFLERGLSYVQIGTLISIREITRNIFEIPAGILADAIGRKRIMVVSFTFYIISFITFYLSSSYWLFILAMVLYAFGDACRTGTHKAMIFSYLKKQGWASEKTHYYGHTRSWSQKGSALSALIAASIIIFGGSYNDIFLYSTIPYVIELVLLISYPSYLNGQTKKISWKQIASSFYEVFADVWHSLRKKKMLVALTNTSIFSGYYKAVKDYIQIIITNLALTVPLLFGLNQEKHEALFIGIAFFLIYNLTSLITKNSGKIEKRIASTSKALNMSLLVGTGVGIAAGIAFHFEWLWISLLVFIAIYLIENIRKPIAVSYISDQSDEKVLATSLSTESQLQTLFSALLAPLIGFFADQFDIGYGIAISTALLLIVFPFIMVKKQR